MTIADVTKALTPVFGMLRERFLLVFQVARASSEYTVSFGKLQIALTCGNFLAQFKFVTWLASSCAYVQAFSSSCFCHRQEWEEHQSFQCPDNMQGRVLPWAYHFAHMQLQKMLARANCFTTGTFGGDATFVRLIQGAIRNFATRGEIKIKVFDQLPHLLCRLGFEAGIRERATEQYALLPRDQHDPISVHFMEPGSEMNDAIVAMPAFNQPPDIVLHAVLRLRSASLSDHQNEIPHSLFKRFSRIRPFALSRFNRQRCVQNKTWLTWKKSPVSCRLFVCSPFGTNAIASFVQTRCAIIVRSAVGEKRLKRDCTIASMSLIQMPRLIIFLQQLTHMLKYNCTNVLVLFRAGFVKCEHVCVHSCDTFHKNYPSKAP